jgi:hypothetical protein
MEKLKWLGMIIGILATIGSVFCFVVAIIEYNLLAIAGWTLALCWQTLHLVDLYRRVNEN